MSKQDFMAKEKLEGITKKKDEKTKTDELPARL